MRLDQDMTWRGSNAWEGRSTEGRPVYLMCLPGELTLYCGAPGAPIERALDPGPAWRARFRRSTGSRAPRLEELRLVLACLDPDGRVRTRRARRLLDRALERLATNLQSQPHWRQGARTEEQA